MELESAHFFVVIPSEKNSVSCVVGANILIKYNFLQESQFKKPAKNLIFCTINQSATLI